MTSGAPESEQQRARMTENRSLGHLVLWPGGIDAGDLPVVCVETRRRRALLTIRRSMRGARRARGIA